MEMRILTLSIGCIVGLFPCTTWSSDHIPEKKAYDEEEGANKQSTSIIVFVLGGALVGGCCYLTFPQTREEEVEGSAATSSEEKNPAFKITITPSPEAQGSSPPAFARDMEVPLYPKLHPRRHEAGEKSLFDDGQTLRTTGFSPEFTTSEQTGSSRRLGEPTMTEEDYAKFTGSDMDSDKE